MIRYSVSNYTGVLGEARGIKMKIKEPKPAKEAK